MSKSLPVSVLLGTDVPELAKFVGGKARGARRQGNEAWMVVTRAGARKQEEEEKTLLQKEKDSQVKPSPVETELAEAQSVDAGGAEIKCAETPQGCTLDDDLFSGGRSKVKLTRSQKRAQKQLHQHKMGTGALDISAVELQVLQKEDPSVANLKVGAGELRKTHYYRSDGLLYRQWIPRGCNAELAVDQLVLPTQCRKAVLQLAHEVPIAGHLGKHKTAKRILRRFYWPTLYKDVEDFCRSCQVCQKFSKQKVVKAPLIPLPVVIEPFRRVAMDIVGPLPRTKSGNRYILVICDYATRYPEAVPVKAVDAEHIAEELVRIFARVGIPEEMLTDQGSNFTSQLLSEIYQLLHVHPIRTSPYHPQTDGLVERFNKTLKAMLRKVAAEDELNWDKWLPYLLFAYQEVPQDSTGFSPFELLYGRAVRGPLDILKESWKEPKKCSDNVVSYVLAVQQKLASMSDLVRDNLSEAQRRQKVWYDRNARQRELKPGDLVLVLLPTSAGSLTSQWQGPYPVLHRIGSVNYLVDMHDTRKHERTFHVNMLKKWNTPTYGNYWAEADGEDWTEEEEEIPEWRGGGEGDSKVGDRLFEAQRGQLEE